MPISFGRRGSGGGGGDGTSVDLGPYNVHVVCFYLNSANIANFDANAMTGNVFRVINVLNTGDFADYDVRLAYRTGPLATVILSGEDDISHVPSGVNNFDMGPDTDNLADLNVFTNYEDDAADVDSPGDFHIDEDVPDFVWNTLDEYQTKEEASRSISTILTYWQIDGTDQNLPAATHANFLELVENGDLRVSGNVVGLRAGWLVGNVATLIVDSTFDNDGANFTIANSSNEILANSAVANEQTSPAGVDSVGDWHAVKNDSVAWRLAFSEIDRAREDIAEDLEAWQSTILTFWMRDADGTDPLIADQTHENLLAAIADGSIDLDGDTFVIQAGYLTGNVATLILEPGFDGGGATFLVEADSKTLAILSTAFIQTDVSDIDSAGDWMIQYNASTAGSETFNEIKRARSDIDDLDTRSPIVQILSGNFGATTNANLAQWRGAATDITKPDNIADDEVWAFDFTEGDWEDMGDQLYPIRASLIGDTTANSGDTADLSATPKTFARIVSHQAGRNLNFTWGTGDILLINSTHGEIEGGTIKIYRMR